MSNARLVAGSSTVETRREISLRMDLAATPVVAVLKSMWDDPRTRALKESLRGMREADMLGREGMMRVGKKEGFNTNLLM